MGGSHTCHSQDSDRDTHLLTMIRQQNFHDVLVQNRNLPVNFEPSDAVAKIFI